VKRLVLGGAIVALLAGAGPVLADPPGPNGHNDWGLCNAYAHNGGNNNGRAFQGLEAAAEEADQTVAEWCEANGEKPGGRG